MRRCAVSLGWGLGWWLRGAAVTQSAVGLCCVESGMAQLWSPELRALAVHPLDAGALACIKKGRTALRGRV